MPVDVSVSSDTSALNVTVIANNDQPLPQRETQRNLPKVTKILLTFQIRVVFRLALCLRITNGNPNKDMDFLSIAYELQILMWNMNLMFIKFILRIDPSTVLIFGLSKYNSHPNVSEYFCTNLSKIIAIKFRKILRMLGRKF